MKRLLLVLSFCFVIVGVKAQNIWKPISYSGTFLGAGPDGSIYTTNYIGDHNIMISKDDGETWQVSFPGEGCYFNPFCFTVSKEGRVFVVDNQSDRVVYTSNNGLTWQYTEPIPIESWDNAYMLYAATNNIIVGRTNEQDVFYTIDGGVTWQIHHPDIFDPDYAIYDIIVNENGDVYASIYNPFRTNMGIYHSSVYNINNWELIEFDGLGIRDIAFDPEGNVVCGVVSGSFPGFVHKPGFYAFSSNNSIAISDSGITYTWKELPTKAVLTYSLDHGASFTEIGEELPLSMFTFEGSIYKGFDNHLYFLGNGLKKSVSNADDLINQTDSCWNGGVAYSFDGGEGTYENPYRIASAEQLALLGEWCDHGCYVLTKDICLNGSNGLIWDPIGKVIDEYNWSSFSGVFDGNGHKIYDMRVDEECGSEYGGLFGYTSNATIKNLVVENSTVEINGEKTGVVKALGTIAGRAKHTDIINCAVGDGGVVDADIVGGIVGTSENSNIKNCFNKSTVRGRIAGGIVGETHHDSISCCGNYGIVQGASHFEDFTYTGGITGLGGFVSDCFNRGEIGFFDNLTMPFGVYLGGIVGNNDSHGFIHNSYNIGQINPSGNDTDYIGIIAGSANPESFEDCYWNGDFTVPACGSGPALSSCAFDYDEMTESWMLEEPHHGTTDLLDALNLGSSNDCFWYIDEYGYPIQSCYELMNTEWYYEIVNEGGTVTYQYLECAADTTINGKRAKVMIKSNTLYDKDLITTITHEYVYYDDGKVFWWDKHSHEYTTLYYFNANVGDEWTINVGNQSITMHVDATNSVVYDGKTCRVLTVSDNADVFSGEIICGIGHTTSFFPEKILNNRGFRVDGIRCYWHNGEQMMQFGDIDCNAIYNSYHDVEENLAGEFSVYPNPANGIITIVGTDRVCPPMEYTITNMIGQIIMKGMVSSDNQKIDVTDLPIGMYFIKVGDCSMIFVKE